MKLTCRLVLRLVLAVLSLPLLGALPVLAGFASAGAVGPPVREGDVLVFRGAAGSTWPAARSPYAGPILWGKVTSRVWSTQKSRS